MLGSDFRRVHSLRRCWRPQYTPKLTQRTALLGTLREIFRRYDSQPVGQVISKMNPILRGWVTCLRIGNAARRFAHMTNWVEKKIRRHLMRARNRPGFGWTRWSTVGARQGAGVVPRLPRPVRGPHLNAIPGRWVAFCLSGWLRSAQLVVGRGARAVLPSPPMGSFGVNPIGSKATIRHGPPAQTARLSPFRRPVASH